MHFFCLLRAALLPWLLLLRLLAFDSTGAAEVAALACGSSAMLMGDRAENGSATSEKARAIDGPTNRGSSATMMSDEERKCGEDKASDRRGSNPTKNPSFDGDPLLI